jgi:hypothetical protein
MENIMRISEMKTEELLGGLEPVQMDPDTLLRAWVNAHAVHPGTTRVPAATLYDDFRKWYLAAYHSKQGLPSVTAWGKLMKARFKHGRGRVGILYYISRKSTEKLVSENRGLGW